MIPFFPHPVRRCVCRHGRHAAIVFGLLLLVLLAGCAGAPPTPPPEPTPATPDQAFARGDYAVAAKRWQQAAETAETAAEADALRIDAANAWLLAGRTDEAREVLGRVAAETLEPPDAARLRVLQADLALREQRPDDAMSLLRGISAALPESWQERYNRVLVDARQRQAGRRGGGLARARELSRSLDRYDPARALELMESLEQLSSGELALRADNPRSDRLLTGWLDLALVIRRHLAAPEGLETAVDEWRGRHAFHPLSRSQALDLWLRYRQRFRPPVKAAVLLPEGGRFGAAATAIRDGIVSAYLNNPSGGELTFVPAGPDPLATPAAYFEAREQGAEWILGPLQPESVRSLIGLAGLATPVLALNSLPPGFLAPAGLQGQIYGLSLAQEDEVRATAREAIRNGLRRAVILAPENDWGDRMAAVFRQEFLREDTEILASTRYLESENDHSVVLERLLKIDESKARARSLENTLQMNLDFEPVRRHDVDVIFLVANPAQGRQLRPQLRFHSAGDLPVYATGRIYSGIPDPAQDQDLDGVRFPITPLQLEAAASGRLPPLPSLRDGAFASLYALGLDAWNVLPWLELMKQDTDFRFPGASGDYRYGVDGNLVRKPAFAEFHDGSPVPVADSAASFAHR